MNPEEQPDEFVEGALRELRPRAASTPLRERLSRAEPVHSTASAPGVPEISWWQLLLRVAAPGVALLIAVLAVQQPPPVKPILRPEHVKPSPKPETTDVLYRPVEANRLVLDSEELAVVPGPNNEPVQLVRVRLLDYEKGQADDGSELFITSEHEQVIPVTLTVY